MQDLTKSGKYLKLGAGAILSKQGQDVHSALLVLKGEVRMERRVETCNRTSELGALKAGQLYGALQRACARAEYHTRTKMLAAGACAHSKTHAHLTRGHGVGMNALLLGQTRSATLTVMEHGPAELLEVSFARQHISSEKYLNSDFIRSMS